jgi:hypothetical protein
VTMNRYEITVTFTADRPLTEDEQGTLAERIALEVEEPQTRDDDGMPTDADYRTAFVEVCWGS